MVRVHAGAQLSRAKIIRKFAHSAPQSERHVKRARPVRRVGGTSSLPWVALKPLKRSEYTLLQIFASFAILDLNPVCQYSYFLC